MQAPGGLPNGVPLLTSLLLTPERLRSGRKIAIDVPVLRAILCLAASTLPFDEEFYLKTYPDVADAYHSGEIADLHMHFVEVGYFEGRLPTRPQFDDIFYKEMYPDVAAAVATGELESALDHYIKTGAAECRFANRSDMLVWERWLQIVGAGSATEGDTPSVLAIDGRVR